MASRTPYGDSVERLRLALKLLEGFRSRVAALPEEGPSRNGAAIAAAALASVHEPAASDPDPDFVPAATFRHAKEGFAFTTGPRGTGYYRQSTLDATVSRPGQPANRHARELSTELPETAGSPSLEGASGGGSCSDFNDISAGGSPQSHKQTQQSSSAERFASQRQAAADEWAAVESNDPQPRSQPQSPSRQPPLPQKTMSRMSDHVADDASFESDDEDDDDDDNDGSSSRSDTTSSSNLPSDANETGPASGSSGGPYSALTRSIGASPRGEGGARAGKSFQQQQQLSSDSDGLSSRDSPPKRPRDMHVRIPAQHDSSDDGEIEFG